MERLEVADHGDTASGFREVYAHSGEPEHDTGSAFVRFDDVLLVVSVRSEVTDPYDRSLFDEIVDAAVSKAASSFAS